MNTLYPINVSLVTKKLQAIIDYADIQIKFVRNIVAVNQQAYDKRSILYRLFHCRPTYTELYIPCRQSVCTDDSGNEIEKLQYWNAKKQRAKQIIRNIVTCESTVIYLDDDDVELLNTEIKDVY